MPHTPNKELRDRLYNLLFAEDGILKLDLRKDRTCNCHIDEDRLGKFIEEEIARAVREVCICAAVIAEDGTIMRGQRHSDCIWALRDRNKKLGSGAESQGFITSMGRYVTRIEGRKLQDVAGIKSVSKGGYCADTLFSEDLY